ncbi:MAG TPA: hypothetical protein VF920_01235 [Dongiaceae bacterium]
MRAIDYPTHRRPDLDAGPIPRPASDRRPSYSAAQNKGLGRNNQGKRPERHQIAPDSAIRCEDSHPGIQQTIGIYGKYLLIEKLSAAARQGYFRDENSTM